MPISSIDLSCEEGIVRVSFYPHLAPDRVLALREQLSDLSLAELRERLQTAAAAWQVKVDLQLLAR